MIHGSLDVQYEGVHLRMDNWAMPMHWTVDQGYWGLAVSVIDAPRLRLEGDSPFIGILLGVADASLGLTQHAQDLADGIGRGATMWVVSQRSCSID